MKNDTRSNVHHRNTALCLALSAALFAAPVSAEVGLPPPAQHQGAGFPSEQALRQKGYDPKTGVWRVQSQNNGKPTVTKSGDSIKGSQSKTITATGNYGEKATIRTTQTQSVNIPKVEKIAGGTLAGLTAAGGAIGSDFAAAAYNNAKAGDWGGAAREGFGAVLEGLSKLDFTDFGGGVNRFLDKTGIRPNSSSGQLEQAAQQAAAAQAQAEKGGDLGGAIAAAAAQKAAEGAAEAAKQQEQWKKAKESQKENGLYPVNVIFREQSPTGKIYYSNKIYYSYLKNFYGNNNGVNQGGLAKIYLPGVQGDYVYYQFKDKNSSTVGVEASSTFKPDPQKTVENMTLNQKDIKDILERMLNNQQTNHAELMNQLSKIGDSVEKSTISNEFEPMTADSAPYTPQGSNTPQQTRFTINRDGSITTTIIPRPDLKPNSTLAPTRSVIIPTPNKGQNTPTTPNSPNTPTTPDSPNAPTTPNSPNTPNQPNSPTGQQNQNQENQQQNFCQQNPNAAQCMPGGDTTYEDIVLPENTIDLDFRPENVFQTEGVCPQPKSVDLGAFGQVEFSYQPLCDFAAKLRPVLIMMTILTCAWFVYGALEEL
jgi:putative integumentary mucin A.1